MRFNELRDALRLRLAGESASSSRMKNLKAVVGLLAGPGVVWELEFGSWVLLQPERINAYAPGRDPNPCTKTRTNAAACRKNESRNGDLAFERPRSSASRRRRAIRSSRHAPDARRSAAYACASRRKEAPLLDLPQLLSPRTSGPRSASLPSSSATNSTAFSTTSTPPWSSACTTPNSFNQDKLWRYAADFRTLSNGKQLGVKLDPPRGRGGANSKYISILPSTPSEKIHLQPLRPRASPAKGTDVMRLRHYLLPHCGTPVGNREAAMNRLQAWLDGEADRRASGWVRKIISGGTKRLPPSSASIAKTAFPSGTSSNSSSPATKLRIASANSRKESDLASSNESKERALVGEVISPSPSPARSAANSPSAITA